MSVRDKVKSTKETPTAKDRVKGGNGKGQRQAAKDKVKNSQNRRVKRERFERLKMWVAVLTSLSMKDRGKIPEDIGDNILISNNMYTTKLYMTSIIRIVELSIDTPVTLLGCIREELRKHNVECIADFTLKNEYFEVKLKDAGLRSRIEGWENSLNSDISSPKMKERAARCLYTVEVATKGNTLMKTRMYIQISSKSGHQLSVGEKVVYDYLNSIGCTYMPVYSDVQKTLEYMSLISDHKDVELKDVAPIITSFQTLAEMFPNCGSINDKQGAFVGVDIRHGLIYRIDLAQVTMARNIYVVAPSGVGKTVLATNLAQSQLEQGSAGCFMDIKGNEYNNLVNAVEGYVVSLRPTSSEYINTWVMHKDDVDDKGAESYFQSRFDYSKRQMRILSGVRRREDVNEMEELLDNFHKSLYVSIGARSDNRNSWRTTESLTPYYVFEMFEQYMTPEMMGNYKSFAKQMIGNLRMYMSKTGSKSYVFKREFDYASILKCRAISFDFGILASSAEEIDMNLFELKFLYMTKLNSEYVTHNYASGRRTFKILEESQIVSSEMLKMYVEEFTLRRSQMQDTLLLGNSVSALMDKEIAKPIVENTRCLLVGELGKEARDKVIQEFGIQHLEHLLRLPGSTPEYANSFVCHNMMQKRTLYPIIKVFLGKGRKVFTPVKEGNAGSGMLTEGK